MEVTANDGVELQCRAGLQTLEEHFGPFAMLAVGPLPACGETNLTKNATASHAMGDGGASSQFA